MLHDADKVHCRKMSKASLGWEELATSRDVHDGLINGMHQNKFAEVGNDPGERRAITVELAAEQDTQRSKEDGWRDEHKRHDTQRERPSGFPLQFGDSLTVHVHHNIGMFSVGDLWHVYRYIFDNIDGVLQVHISCWDIGTFD